MPRPSKQERFDKIHQEALTRFNRIQSVVYAEREQCLQDRRFYSIAGAQWEDELGQQFENKPKIEINKIHLSIIRIINEYRNNRITVDFKSKDGSDDDTLADTCDGLYRADEQDSSAQEAYDNAFEEAVGGGIGAWRLCNEYEDEEDEDDGRQRIRFEPIYDADSCVFFDLQAKKQDKSDARFAYILSSMDREAYREEYNDDPATWPKDITQTQFDWFTDDVVYIAEYYVIKEKSKTIVVFEGLDGKEIKHEEEELFEVEDEEAEKPVTLLQKLQAFGYKEVRRKKVKTKRVHKYIMSGAKVLEDCGEIAGPNIPIVITYGKRWFVDNVERAMGHVRLAKDPQRLKNMQSSKLAEISALSSVEKPIFTPEQMAGHTVMWQEDNIKNYPYLLVNPIMDQNGNVAPVGPIAYTKPPMVPPALAALLQITDQDIKELLGVQEQMEEVNPNISGVAIDLLQNRLDMQTFIYLSNFAKAMRRCGQIWLGMAREVYVEEGRKMKTVGMMDEDVGQVTLRMKTVLKDKTIGYDNDLTKAKFDVNVDVGPSSSSRRAASARTLINMAGVAEDPESKQILIAGAIMNMEGEGLGEFRTFFRKKLLSMGVLQPSKEEAEEMAQAQANQPPDPNQQYLQAAAAAEEARAQEARADVVLKAAKADEARAKTIETMTNVDKTEQEQALQIIDRFNQNLSGVETKPTSGM